MEIRLSDETLTGLRRLCNRSLVNEDYFYRLLKEFLKTGQSSAEKPEKDKSIYILFHKLDSFNACGRNKMIPLRRMELRAQAYTP